MFTFSSDLGYVIDYLSNKYLSQLFGNKKLFQVKMFQHENERNYKCV